MYKIVGPGMHEQTAIVIDGRAQIYRKFGAAYDKAKALRQQGRRVQVRYFVSPHDTPPKRG